MDKERRAIIEEKVFRRMVDKLSDDDALELYFIITLKYSILRRRVASPRTIRAFSEEALNREIERRKKEYDDDSERSDNLLEMLRSLGAEKRLETLAEMMESAVSLKK